MIVRHPFLLLVAALGSACWVDPDPAPRADPYPATTTPAPVTSGSASTGPISKTPILALVDTGRTLNAAPGEGVGIFVEYAAGGKWHIWWTCDTKKTNASCDFDIGIASESGDIQSIQSEGVLASDSIVSTDPRTISARSTTGDNAVGVHFTAPPRGIITVDAMVGGVRDPAYFFFVQDGVPNGGFSGALTNPIRFQGKSP